jgi:hypothetical protein
MKDNFEILGNEILEKALDPDRIKRLSIIYGPKGHVAATAAGNFNLVDWFLKN